MLTGGSPLRSNWEDDKFQNIFVKVEKQRHLTLNKGSFAEAMSFLLLDKLVYNFTFTPITRFTGAIGK